MVQIIYFFAKFYLLNVLMNLISNSLLFCIRSKFWIRSHGQIRIINAHGSRQIFVSLNGQVFKQLICRSIETSEWKKNMLN
jgi:hypothetical protein